MQELAVVCNEERFEEVLSELKPVTPVIWGYDRYTIDTNSETVKVIAEGFERFKDSLRYIHDFGKKLYSELPKLFLAFRDMYNCLRSVADPNSTESYTYRDTGCLLAMSATPRENFQKFCDLIGVSDTTAYLYKDLATFVDKETSELYPEFQGYSLSVLAEILALNKDFAYGLSKIKSIISVVVPKDTTVERMRYYRKIMRAWFSFKDPFVSDKVCKKITQETPLPEVIEIYEKLLQKEEQKNLNAMLSDQPKDKPKEEELAGNEILIKSLRDQIKELQRCSVPNLGKCDGCMYQGNNLNKCRCCRRYSDLKDLFKSE